MSDNTNPKVNQCRLMKVNDGQRRANVSSRKAQLPFHRTFLAVTSKLSCFFLISHICSSGFRQCNHVIPWRNSSDSTDRFHRLVPGSVSIRFGELTNTLYVSRHDNELIQRQFKLSRVLIIFKLLQLAHWASCSHIWTHNLIPIVRLFFLCWYRSSVCLKKDCLSGRGASPPSPPSFAPDCSYVG